MKQSIAKKSVHPLLRRGLSICLSMAILVGLLPLQPLAYAQDNVIEISTYDQLKAQAMFTTEAGGSQNFEGITLKLTADIQVPEVTDDSSASDIAYATCIFGSTDNPFKGTFDGNGYTISGLRYHTVWNEPRADTGLFAATDGAVIQNLTLESADIESDMRGGIIVGYAKNTLFNHVTVKNSNLKLEAVDNVLLIGTDLGIRGGGIAGELVDSTMYDCEVNNCWIRSNNTSGVAALAGKPLTLGGLVGCAEGSTIEYSRVIGDTPYDENAPSGTSAANSDTGKTLIKIYYDVAVGAIGGNTLYVGGIAGRIWSNNNGKGDKGTAIIDCFSTAEMNYYCATYVSVLGVNVGHIGGITAEVWDDNCSITRCHYAGRATSYQYNALLVIPIIQRDVNVSGVADMWQGKADAARQNIYGSFFKVSVNGSNKTSMTTLGDGLTGEISSNGNFGPWSDTLYTNREAWETFDFDFTGTTPRTSDYDAYPSVSTSSHFNKWVMDYNLGIPVHGSSVAATLDFPGGGTVSLDATDLVGASVSTSDPYTFAVQGIYANEPQFTLRYTPASSGYRLYGWYRFPDILDDTAPETPRYFQQLYNTYASIPDVPVYGANGEQIQVESVSNPVSTSNTYTPTNVENQPVQWQDNDLFTARIQALVRFYDFENTLLDRQSGRADPNTEDDWYFYQDALPTVTPSQAPGDENTTLLGWTTRIPSDWGNSYSYAATSAALLQELKINGEFYEPGDSITKPMDLYPVYAGLASNVITQFEGYMYDVSGNHIDPAQQNPANRPGVGTTSATVDLSGGPTNASVTLSFQGSGTDGALSNGYRFLGWYEDGHRISTEETPTLTGVDLTVEHTYLARFEYAVSYMVKSGNWGHLIDSEYKDGKEYTQIWHTFGQPVEQIPGLNFSNETFDHWCTDKYQGDSPVTDQTVVHIPMSVYSHNEELSSLARDVDLLHDFPGAGSVTLDYYDIYQGNITASPNQGYQFVGWSFENKGHSSESYNSSGTSNPRDTTTRHDFDLVYYGHFVAEIQFHTIAGDNLSTVTRRYQQPLFADAGTYTYPFYLRPDTLTTVSHTWEAAPTSAQMDQAGYVFLGWVDGSGLVAADGTLTAEGTYLWDRYQETEKFLTSNPDAAVPYLLPDTAVVTSTMDLYPVYAPYDITYTTNFQQAGIEATELYNVPELPVETTKTPTDNNTYTVSFTVDSTTPVMPDNASAGMYTVTRVEVVDNTTTERTEATHGQDGSYTLTGLKLGHSYTVVAYYRPMVVIYHLGGADQGDQLDVSTRDLDAELGNSPTPLNATQRVGTGRVFLGWTTAAPGSGNPFHLVATADALPLVTSDTLVQCPMELWPVYVSTVTVASNLDSHLTNPTDVRSLTISSPYVKSGTLTAETQVTVGADTYYTFVGWYKNDGSDTGYGSCITQTPTFTLSGGDLYAAGVTYTAVYETAYRITYHGNEAGEVVYTALVPQSEHRTFVTTMELPDDTGAVTSVQVPVDTEAFTRVEDQMAVNQVFREWQYVPSSGQPQRWSEFCQQTITQNMDLYPVALSVTVTGADSILETLYREDSSTAPIDQSKLEVRIGLGTSRQGDTTAIGSVSVLVMSEYKQGQLTTSIQEQAYAPASGGITSVDTPQEDIPVTLTLRRHGDLSISDSEASQVYATQTTNTTGETVFSLTGSLTLHKELADGTQVDSGEVFLVNVAMDSQTQTLPLQAERALSLTQIPYGTNWTVAEQEDWAWRYTATVSQSQGQLTSYHPTADITITNQKASSQWLDDSAYVHNVFGEGASSAPTP